MGWKAVCLTVFALFSFACGPEADPPPAEETVTYTAVGVVKKADLEAMKITIDHEDIPGYMSAMEMTEKTSDRSIIASINPATRSSSRYCRKVPTSPSPNSLNWGEVQRRDQGSGEIRP